MGDIVRIEDPEAIDETRVGRKFAALARASRLGIAVPEAVAVGTRAHASWRSSGAWPEGLKEEVLAAAVGYLEAIGRPGAEAACREAFAAVDEISARDPGRFIRPVAGAVALVRALRAQGCRVAVATQDLTARGRLALAALGLEQEIDALAGSDRVSRPKPHSEAIHLLLAELGIPAAQAVMVGDAPTDLEMARRAGLSAAVGVLGGITPEETLRSLTPYVVRDLTAIRVRPAGQGT